MELIKLILVAVALIGLGVIGLGLKIMLHKSHKFPETSAGHNKELRKRGISCPKHDEIKCWGRNDSRGCATCFEHARD
jgi:hypothetical protein